MKTYKTDRISSRGLYHDIVLPTYSPDIIKTAEEFKANTRNTTPEQTVLECREMWNSGRGLVEISEKLQIKVSTVKDIVSGKSFPNLEDTKTRTYNVEYILTRFSYKPDPTNTRVKAPDLLQAVQTFLTKRKYARILSVWEE